MTKGNILYKVNGFDTMSLFKKCAEFRPIETGTYPAAKGKQKPIPKGYVFDRNTQKTTRRQEIIATALNINPNDSRFGQGLAHTALTDCLVLREIMRKLLTPMSTPNIPRAPAVQQTKPTKLFIPMLQKEERFKLEIMGLTDMNSLMQFHNNIKKENWLQEYMVEWRIGMAYLNNYSKK